MSRRDVEWLVAYIFIFAAVMTAVTVVLWWLVE
jgi:hypothetical protein